MNVRLREPAAAALLVALAASCENATNVELLEIPATGVVAGVAYLDSNGNGALDASDQILEDVVVELSAGAQIIASSTTDTAGIYIIDEVPLGRYGISVGSAVLGDSLQAVAADSVTVVLTDTVQLEVGASFPMVTLEEALASQQGLRVFTSGIALSRRLSFGDGQVHFQGESAFLRALNVERSGFQVGDSVRLRGRVIEDNGRPALDSVTVNVLVGGAAVIDATESTTTEVASADGAALDGGLAIVRAAEITDTATVGADFHVWLDDGSGPVEMVLRSFVGADPNLYPADTVVRVQSATGLVSPYDDGGTVRWRLLPRLLSDVTLETKTLNIGVSLAMTDTASIGDTIAIDVTLTTSGLYDATNVVVYDTLPSGLTYVSSSATAGGYSATEHRWDVGTIPDGASRTLQILAEVTTATLGPQTNNVWLQPLTHEVDQTAGDNFATASVQLEAPRPVPCLTSTPSCEERIEVANGVYLPAFTSHSIVDGDPNVTRAVIMVHGLGRNADDYFDTSVTAATNEGVLGQTLLIAPHFQAAADGPAPDEARWTVEGWRRGDVSEPALGPQVSSYTAMEAIVVDVVMNSLLFPSITEVVIAGHSSGADLVHRVAALTDFDEQFGAIDFRYVVANAESYLYAGPERDVAGTFQIPDIVACPTYDNWRYGLQIPNTYVGAVPADSVRARIARRDVRMLLGDADTTRDDSTCGADLQGVHRYERGQFLKNFMDQFFAGNGHVQLVIPGVGHVQLDMFNSVTGRDALFGN